MKQHRKPLLRIVVIRRIRIKIIRQQQGEITGELLSSSGRQASTSILAPME